MKRILFAIGLLCSFGAAPVSALPPEIEFELRLARVVADIDAGNYDEAKDDLSFLHSLNSSVIAVVAAEAPQKMEQRAIYTAKYWHYTGNPGIALPVLEKYFDEFGRTGAYYEDALSLFNLADAANRERTGQVEANVQQAAAAAARQAALAAPQSTISNLADFLARQEAEVTYQENREAIDLVRVRFEQMVGLSIHSTDAEVSQSDSYYAEVEVENGEWNGKGLIIWWKDGGYDFYVGEFRSGDRHGDGYFSWHDGDSYLGSFVSNERTGHGVYNSSNGGKYTGAFLNGQASGQGRLDFPDGASYEGDWLNNMREGSGRLAYENGNVYTGLWRNGKRHDQNGQLVFSDGGRYQGEFVDGVFVSGRIYQANGLIMSGSFLDGRLHGNGRITFPPGNGFSYTQHCEGYFQNGRLVGVGDASVDGRSLNYCRQSGNSYEFY